MRGKGGKWEGEREKKSRERGEGKRCRRRWEIGEESGSEEGSGRKERRKGGRIWSD